MNLKDISKKLPSTINGHHGQLTIMKRNDSTYYCLYPQATKETVPVMKGKSIELVCKKMYKALVDRDIILEEKKKKKMKFKNKNIRKPMSKKQKLANKLRVQNRTLKNK